MKTIKLIKSFMKFLPKSRIIVTALLTLVVVVTLILTLNCVRCSNQESIKTNTNLYEQNELFWLYIQEQYRICSQLQVLNQSYAQVLEQVTGWLGLDPYEEVEDSVCGPRLPHFKM